MGLLQEVQGKRWILTKTRCLTSPRPPMGMEDIVRLVEELEGVYEAGVYDPSTLFGQLLLRFRRLSRLCQNQQWIRRLRPNQQRNRRLCRRAHLLLLVCFLVGQQGVVEVDPWQRPTSAGGRSPNITMATSWPHAMPRP